MAFGFTHLHSKYKPTSDPDEFIRPESGTLEVRGDRDTTNIFFQLIGKKVVPYAPDALARKTGGAQNDVILPEDFPADFTYTIKNPDTGNIAVAVTHDSCIHVAPDGPDAKRYAEAVRKAKKLKKLTDRLQQDSTTVTVPDLSDIVPGIHNFVNCMTLSRFEKIEPVTVLDADGSETAVHGFMPTGSSLLRQNPVYTINCNTLRFAPEQRALMEDAIRFAADHHAILQNLKSPNSNPNIVRGLAQKEVSLLFDTVEDSGLQKMGLSNRFFSFEYRRDAALGKPNDCKAIIDKDTGKIAFLTVQDEGRPVGGIYLDRSVLKDKYVAKLPEALRTKAGLQIKPAPVKSAAVEPPPVESAPTAIAPKLDGKAALTAPEWEAFRQDTGLAKKPQKAEGAAYALTQTRKGGLTGGDDAWALTRSTGTWKKQQATVAEFIAGTSSVSVSYATADKYIASAIRSIEAARSVVDPEILPLTEPKIKTRKIIPLTLVVDSPPVAATGSASPEAVVSDTVDKTPKPLEVVPKPAKKHLTLVPRPTATPEEKKEPKPVEVEPMGAGKRWAMGLTGAAALLGGAGIGFNAIAGRPQPEPDPDPNAKPAANESKISFAKVAVAVGAIIVGGALAFSAIRSGRSHSI